MSEEELGDAADVFASDEAAGKPAGDDPVLTEEEIDALVEASSKAPTAGYDDGQYKSHDFGAGEALQIARWVEFDGLIRDHAEMLQELMTRTFNLEVNVEPFAPFYATADEVLASMPERVCMISTHIAPVKGESHLILTGALLGYLVNQYFGGGAMEAPKLTGKVTPSEQRLGEKVAREFLTTMVEAWSDHLAIAPGDLYVDITPDRLALEPKATAYVTLTFLVTIGDSLHSEIRLLMPFIGLELNEAAFLPKVVSSDPDAPHDEWHDKLSLNLPNVAVEVAGVIEEVEISIRELLSLQQGSVIPIDEPKLMKLFVEGQALVRGIYGEHHGEVAMQFVRFEERE